MTTTTTDTNNLRCQRQAAVLSPCAHSISTPPAPLHYYPRQNAARGTPKSPAGGGALRVVPQEMKSPQPFHRVRWAACGRNQQWQQGGQGGAAKSNQNHAQIAYCTWCSQKKVLKQHRTASAFAISKECEYSDREYGSFEALEAAGN